jgi:hypothetical protein
MTHYLVVLLIEADDDDLVNKHGVGYTPHTGRGGGARALPARRAGGTAAARAGARRPRPAPPACAACRGIGSLSATTGNPTALETFYWLNKR